jgi:hypothetical protein
VQFFSLHAMAKKISMPTMAHPIKIRMKLLFALTALMNVAATIHTSAVTPIPATI